MKVIFDHNLPKRFRQHVTGHSVSTTREMGWEALANGQLLQAASRAGFDAFISIDKNLQHEQNLRTLPIPAVVLDAPSNTLPALAPFAPFLIDLLKSPLQRALYVIEPTGRIRRIPAP